MAVTPNTTFVSGAVLTAAQQNAFPRGLMTDIVTSSTTYNLTTSAVIQLTTASFTAVTGRLYKITYYEPVVKGTTNAGLNTIDFQIKLGATVLALSSTPCVATSALYAAGLVVYVGALAAGATVITCNALASSTTGTPQLQRYATSLAFLIVEDIGAS